MKLYTLTLESFDGEDTVLTSCLAVHPYGAKTAIAKTYPTDMWKVVDVIESEEMYNSDGTPFEPRPLGFSYKFPYK